MRKTILTLLALTGMAFAVNAQNNYDMVITKTDGSVISIPTDEIRDVTFEEMAAAGIEVGDIVTIMATSTYINPSGRNNVFTAQFTATVVAPTAQGAKECAVSREPYIEYTSTTEEATASE